MVLVLPLIILGQDCLNYFGPSFSSFVMEKRSITLMVTGHWFVNYNSPVICLSGLYGGGEGGGDGQFHSAYGERKKANMA